MVLNLNLSNEAIEDITTWDDLGFVEEVLEAWECPRRPVACHYRWSSEGERKFRFLGTLTLRVYPRTMSSASTKEDDPDTDYWFLEPSWRESGANNDFECRKVTLEGPAVLLTV